MSSIKGLYAVTLALAGTAGFSSGWALRPADKVALSPAEAMLARWEASYRVTAEDRTRLLDLLRRYEADLDGLRSEFDRKFGDQVDAVQDRYDAEIRAVLTPEKRK
jgi:hypothetical protein